MRRWTWELEHSISGLVEYMGWRATPIRSRDARVLADQGVGDLYGEQGGVWSPPTTGWRCDVVEAAYSKRPTL